MTTIETRGQKRFARRREGRIELLDKRHLPNGSECLKPIGNTAKLASNVGKKTKTTDRYKTEWQPFTKRARQLKIAFTFTTVGVLSSSERLNNHNASITRRTSRKTAGAETPARMCRPQTKIDEVDEMTQHPGRHKRPQAHSPNKNADYYTGFESKHTQIVEARQA